MLVASLALTFLAVADVSVVEIGDRKVEFLSGDEARAYVLAETGFEAFNDHLDLSLRVEEDLSGLSRDEVQDRARTHFANQVLDWTDHERRWVTGMLETVHGNIEEKFGACRVPRTTTMLKTTGEENFEAFYTIGDAIVYPQTNFRFVRLPARRAQLEETLAHEYWHVLSRQDDALRDAAYAVFGFEKVDRLSIPRSITERRVHNPDVRNTPYVLTIGPADARERVVLLLVSRFPAYVGRKGVLGRLNTAVGYVEVRAFPVGPDDVVRDEPREIGDAILDRIGTISSYRYGADEIVAEAFEALYAEEDVDGFGRADQELLGNLQAVLTCERAN